MTGRVIVIGGGVRSGKSAFALARGRALGERRCFVATAQAFDAEMAARIADHVRTRGSDFATVEEPVALVDRLAALRDVDVVVVDCLTLWLSNLMLAERALDEESVTLQLALRGSAGPIVLVANEVGLGIVPETPLGRRFRDAAGRLNQEIAALADRVIFVAAGLPLVLKDAKTGAPPHAPTLPSPACGGGFELGSDDDVPQSTPSPASGGGLGWECCSDARIVRITAGSALAWCGAPR